LSLSPVFFCLHFWLNTTMTTQTTRVAVLGATGYVGGQAMAILAGHPNVTITVATSVRYTGKTVADVYPALAPLAHLPLTELDVDSISRQADVVLSALPHGQSAQVLGAIADTGVKVVDLSADYRFDDPEIYAEAYHQPHPRPELARASVYGLVEHNRERIQGAHIVGVPGCYPTATLLALLPALKAGLLDSGDGVIVDAKSGISGAGRSTHTANLFCEVDGGVRAYNVGGHRHQPEMAFQAERIGGEPVSVFFTPQVVPMTRGILSCVYGKRTPGTTMEALRECYEAAYAGSAFGQVLPSGHYPSTKHVAGTNRFVVGIGGDDRGDRVVLICAIDNLIKGAAGQGIQCMNLMLGLPETTALPVMGAVI